MIVLMLWVGRIGNVLCYLGAYSCAVLILMGLLSLISTLSPNDSHPFVFAIIMWCIVMPVASLPVAGVCLIGATLSGTAYGFQRDLSYRKAAILSLACLVFFIVFDLVVIVSQTGSLNSVWSILCPTW